MGWLAFEAPDTPGYGFLDKVYQGATQVELKIPGYCQLGTRTHESQTNGPMIRVSSVTIRG